MLQNGEGGFSSKYVRLIDSIIKKENMKEIRIWWIVRYRKQFATISVLGLDKLSNAELKVMLSKWRYLCVLCHIEGMVRSLVTRDEYMKLYDDIKSDKPFIFTDSLANIERKIASFLGMFFKNLPIGDIIIYDTYKNTKVDTDEVLNSLMYTALASFLIKVLFLNTPMFKNITSKAMAWIIESTCDASKHTIHGLISSTAIKCKGIVSEIFLRILGACYNTTMDLDHRYMKYSYTTVNKSDIKLWNNIDVYIMLDINDVRDIPYGRLFYSDSICTSRYLVSYSSRGHIGSYDINKYHGENPNVFKLLIDVLESRVERYKIIRYRSRIIDSDMIAMISKNNRLIRTFSYIIDIASMDGDTESAIDSYSDITRLRYMNTLELFNSYYIGQPILIIIPSSSSGLIDVSSCAFLRSSVIFSHTTFLVLDNEDDMIAITSHEANGADIILDSRYNNGVKADVSIVENAYKELSNFYPNMSCDNFGITSNAPSTSNLELKEDYNIEYLNLENIDLNNLITKIKKFYSKYKNDSISFVFHGDSGNGKSNLASYIAKKCNKRLTTLSGSNIISKWVGETEQKINKIFTTNTHDDILLIEEAEALLGNRSNSDKSWEDTTTNEFLTQLERFKGTLIITTNNLEYLDKAFLRRFNLKIKFLSLRESDISKIITKNKAYFNLSGNLPKDYLTRLNGLRLGDVGNVNKNIKLFGIETVREYVDELSKEVANRSILSNNVGFITGG